MKRNLFICIKLSLIICFLLSSCGENPTVSNFQYLPQNFNDGWITSTPEEQGVDINALADAYQSAEYLNNIYSLLVVKNGYLIAESYYNGATFFDRNGVASVTKSISSALTGIALREGFLTSIDKRMNEFFPEINFNNLDPRKSDITIQHLLQMRSGFPWEEPDGFLNEYLSAGNYIPLIDEFPLVHNPGTEFGYSMMSAHLMGIVLARASNQSLLSFAETYLFDPLNISVGFWLTDSLGYHHGGANTSFTPREMARFGQLYLDNGLYNGNQILPSAWVQESLQTYSDRTYMTDIFDSISDLGYGYYWWSGVSGNHHFNFAWGHGGQMIAIVLDLNMVIVVTAEGQPGFDNSVWLASKAVMEIAGRLISNL